MMKTTNKFVVEDFLKFQRGEIIHNSNPEKCRTYVGRCLGKA